MRKINGTAVEQALSDGHATILAMKMDNIQQMIATILVCTLCALMLFK